MSNDNSTRMPRWIELPLRFKLATLREDPATILLKWGSVIHDEFISKRAQSLAAATTDQLPFLEYRWTEKALESLTPEQLTALRQRVKEL
jgi:hypothetical protein